MTHLAVGRNRVIALAVAVVAGSLVAVQSRVNGELSHRTGASIFPAWFTMTSGLALLVVVLAVHQQSRRGLVDVVGAIRDGIMPRYVLTGGIFGGLFLITQALAVPLVGVAVFSVGVVAGQTSGSLAVDRMGISASGKRAITWRRVVASVLAVVAVAVGISDRLGSASGALGYAFLAFVAGFLIAPQQAVNGRISVRARSPFSAAFVNFLGGALMLSAFLAVALTVMKVTISAPFGGPAWTYSGGLLGVTVIAASAWVVPKLGVLVFSLASVFGQLSGAFLLDVLAPTPGANVGWHLIAGVALTFVAILIAAAPRRSG